MSMDDFASVIAAAERSVMGRAEAEAAGLGISVDDLFARREAEAASQDAARTRQEACQRRAERISAISAGLTPKMAQAVCQGALRATSVLTVVRRWLHNPAAPAILVLTGGTGTGKTVACAEALASMGGEYVRAVELAERHTPYSGDGDVERLRIQPHELLVLDDVGTERRNGSGQRDPRFMPALYEIFDQRQGSIRRGTQWHQRRTLITTNASKESFMADYASEERIASRLAQSGYFYGSGAEDMRRAHR